MVEEDCYRVLKIYYYHYYYIYLFISIKMVVGRPEAWRYTVLDEL